MNKDTKRKLYIGLFIFLGVELFFFVAALFNMLYIGLLNIDFRKYGFGLTWRQLVSVGRICAAVFLAAGAWYGFLQGKYWWHEIYEAEGGENFFKKRRFFFKAKK